MKGTTGLVSLGVWTPSLNSSLPCATSRVCFLEGCALGYPLQKEATLAALTEETVKSSAIEGEVLNPESVRSSLARRMGLSVAGAAPIDRNIEGIVEMMLDATRNYGEPLTYDRLFGWHAALFPFSRSGIQKIRTGAWREGGIQVVSGAAGTEKVHLGSGC